MTSVNVRIMRGSVPACARSPAETVGEDAVTTVQREAGEVGAVGMDVVFVRRAGLYCRAVRECIAATRHDRQRRRQTLVVAVGFVRRIECEDGAALGAAGEAAIGGAAASRVLVERGVLQIEMARAYEDGTA